MRNQQGIYLFAVSVLTALVITGCGSNSNSPSAGTAPTATVISGVVASGGPIENARVDIKDQTGKNVGSGVTAPDGSFSIEIDPSFSPHMVMTATSADETLVSMVDTRVSTTVNVNTISTLVAALMSASGNPSALAAELASGQVTFDEKSIVANWGKVESILKPLLTALNTEIAGLRSGPAPANGTGPDRLLDALDIGITKNADNTSTIQISIKSAGEEQEMPVIRFTNSMLLERILKDNGITPTAIQNQAIQAANLPASGTSAQIADLLKRMTACFSLPVVTRVDIAAGTVTAPQCRTLFKNDDPANYLHSGAVVGAASAFPGLFAESGTGAGYGQGTFEYRRDNGDIVFSFISVSKTLVSRREESVATPGRDGKLRLTGNQYRFAGSVNPMAEVRGYMQSGLGGLISTGYDIKIPLQEINDEKIVRVDVTSPRGVRYSLVRGSSSMTLPKLDSRFNPEVDDNSEIVDSSSAFVRLRVITATDSLFNDGKTAPAVPYTGERDLQLPRQNETDDTIASYPPRGIWTLAYFTANSQVPVATQAVRTRARAMSVEELKNNRPGVPLYSYYLTDESLKPLLDRLYSSSPGSGLYLSLQDLRSTSYAWSTLVPPPFTPLAPVSLRVMGTLLTPSSIPPFLDFVDNVDLSPDMKQAEVPCSFDTGVLHCDAQGRYLENTWLDGVQLLSRDNYGREFSYVASTLRPAQ